MKENIYAQSWVSAVKETRTGRIASVSNLERPDPIFILRGDVTHDAFKDLHTAQLYDSRINPLGLPTSEVTEILKHLL
jgi:hypothetical protein